MSTTTTEAYEYELYQVGSGVVTSSTQPHTDDTINGMYTVIAILVFAIFFAALTIWLTPSDNFVLPLSDSDTYPVRHYSSDNKKNKRHTYR